MSAGQGVEAFGKGIELETKWEGVHVGLDVLPQ